MPARGAGIAGVRESLSRVPGKREFSKQLGHRVSECAVNPFAFPWKCLLGGFLTTEGSFLYLLCGRRVLRPEGSGAVFLHGSGGHSGGFLPKWDPAEGRGQQLLPCARTSCPEVILENALPLHLD